MELRTRADNVTASQGRTTRASTGGGSWLSRREARWGYLFISPWILGFLVFTAGPMIASLYFSFTEYDVLSAPEWVGLRNYTRMFGDELFTKSLLVTVLYTLLAVPLGLIISLFCAILLNQKVRGRAIYRACFFVPTIMPIVAVTFLWTWLLNPRFGLINYLLNLVAIDGPNWLGTPERALPSLVMIGLWSTVGGTVMITFLAALQGVPRHLYEAAALDGANAARQFRHITLPMISPTIFFNAVILIIGSFQTFTLAYVATGGGPDRSTYFYLLHVYNNGFRFFEMGYASALAWVLFVLLLAFTYLQFRLQLRWVHYESEV